MRTMNFMCGFHNSTTDAEFVLCAVVFVCEIIWSSNLLCMLPVKELTVFFAWMYISCPFLLMRCLWIDNCGLFIIEIMPGRMYWKFCYKVTSRCIENGLSKVRFQRTNTTLVPYWCNAPKVCRVLIFRRLWQWMKFAFLLQIECKSWLCSDFSPWYEIYYRTLFDAFCISTYFILFGSCFSECYLSWKAAFSCMT